MAAVRVRILDEYGAVASYAQLPVELHAEGDIALAGTDTVTAEGGMCGTYVRSLGRAGRGTLRIKAAGMDEVSIDFTVTTGEAAYV